MNITDNRISGIKRFGKAVRYALDGLFYLLHSEKNIRIQMVILMIAILAGIFLKISNSGWIAVCLSAGLVLAAESINTAIERLSDSVSTEYNEKIKRAKDVAAAGVMITAAVSIVVGLLVFIPAILKLFHL